MTHAFNVCSFEHSLDKAAAKKENQISGHFALYNTTSELIYGYKRWKWEAGCFDESLASDDEIYMLTQHDWEQVLGRKSKGTASFGSDEKGLWATAKPNMKKPMVQGLMEDLARGDIDGGSVGFIILTDDYSLEDGYDIQHLIKCSLKETSPVTLPRFTSTEGLVGIASSLPLATEEKAALMRALNRASRDLSWINNDDRELLRAHRSEMEPILTPHLLAQLDRHGVNAAPIISASKHEIETQIWRDNLIALDD